MSFEWPFTYLATIPQNHTLVFPPEMSPGTQVMVIVMPNQMAVVQPDEMPSSRFESALANVKAASKLPLPRLPAETDFDSVIDMLRKTLAD